MKVPTIKESSGKLDKKKGLMNISVSLIFKFALLIGSIFVRRILIQTNGNEINGLNSLYLSILDFLSVAELGVGTAITYCMYNPIVEGDEIRVSALYGLFTKIYLIIGVIIFVCGCAIMPCLKFLVKDYQTVDVNLYSTFLLMLISVVISYPFSSKTSLINAHKNNYITTIISSVGLLLQYGMQIAVLIFTKSFVWFLVCRIISMLLQWFATEIVARIKYGHIIRRKCRVDKKTKSDVVKNTKAMFMHKIGSILVNTADSIIISAFMGSQILGKYSNYTTILIAMTGVITLFFTPLTSVIGHLGVGKNSDSLKSYHSFFHSINFIIGIVFYLGYYAVIDNLVQICFGNYLELSKAISFVITLNYFVQFMRQSALLFRDATGTFYYDRWKPVVEGVINIILSITFVMVFPEEYKVVGVIVATIITNLFICHVVEPYVLYKHIYHVNPKGYYIRNYAFILIFACMLIVLNFCMVSVESQWMELLINGSISVGISFGVILIVILCSKNFRYSLKNFVQRFSKSKSSKYVHTQSKATETDKSTIDETVNSSSDNQDINL